jgi:hypothetical protein
MAELNHSVDEKDVETSYEVWPAGIYPVIIDESDLKENKDGTGLNLIFSYQAIDGPLKGRKMKKYYVREFYSGYKNSLSEEERTKKNQAEQIGRRVLNSIGVACGVMKIVDTAQVHNIPFKIDVHVEESEKYRKQNVIKKHMPYGDSAAPQAPVQQQTASVPAPQDAGKKKPQWAR